MCTLYMQMCKFLDSGQLRPIMCKVIHIVFTGVFSFTALALQLLCGLKGVPGFLSLWCSVTNAQGNVTYVCDVDGDSVPCEWSIVM